MTGNGAAPRVLLADQDADTRAMYGEYLRALQFSVDEAADGREALAKALTSAVDIVVTETRLPGMSGLELCSLLRRDPATRAVRILVVTGDVVSIGAGVARAAGADAILVKPCVPEQLAETITVLLTHVEPRGATAAAASGRATAVDSSTTSRTRRVPRNRSFNRGETSDPPTRPPTCSCPACDRRLEYLVSRIGGVTEQFAEQWDYFECAGCGRKFEYRHRVRSLRPCPEPLSAHRRH